MPGTEEVSFLLQWKSFEGMNDKSGANAAIVVLLTNQTAMIIKLMAYLQQNCHIQNSPPSHSPLKA